MKPLVPIVPHAHVWRKYVGKKTCEKNPSDWFLLYSWIQFKVLTLCLIYWPQN